MRALNLVLAFFLSLNATTLILLNLPSCEKLNIMHQMAGYATIFLVVLHSCIGIPSE